MENVPGGVNLKRAKLIKFGLIGVTAFLVAPFVFLTIKGLIGLFIAGVIGLIGINAAPVISMKLANQKVKAIVNEAKTNPIETLYNQLSEKRNDAEKFKASITEFSTEIKNFEDQTVEFKKQYPEDAGRFEAQLNAMNKILAVRQLRYKQVQQGLDEFEKAIQRAQAMWNMSQAAQKMNAIAGLQVGDQFEKIKTDSALNSVMSSMNQAFSEMETALLDNSEVKQALAYQDPNVVPAVTIPVAQPAMIESKN